MPFASKDEALDAMEEARGQWLAFARHAARVCVTDKINAGKPPEVTINDVRDRAPPLPTGVDPRVYGAVLRGPEWELVRYVPSARTRSHKRPVALYRFVG